MSNHPRRPAGLGEAGAALWDSVIPDFELSPTEITILRHACREEDLIDRLHEALSTAELVTRGSMGQEVASPFVSELRQHAATQATLLAKLKLPETPGQMARKKAVVSEKARAAARQRWGTGAGA
jgi:hypothetical protein